MAKLYLADKERSYWVYYSVQCALQLDHLSKDFSVISFDPRGYGQSQKHTREFPKDFYHKDAADAGDSAQ